MSALPQVPPRPMPMAPMPGPMKPAAPRPGMMQPDEGDARTEVMVPDEIKALASDLLKKLQLPEMTTRRQEVRDVHERREFWNGNHWIYWSDVWQAWIVPPVGGAGPTSAQAESDQDQPLGHYSNHYLDYGLDAVALLSSGHSPTKFYPADSKDPDDQVAADGATSYIVYFRRRNRDEFLKVRQAYFLYNDGAFFNYVRPVADGQEFGTSTVPRLSQVETPIGPLPAVSGMVEYPNSEIVFDTYGKLEVRRNIGANTVKELPYIDVSIEVPRSAMRAMYPKIADRIGASASGGGDEDTYEVIARRRLDQGTGQLSAGMLTQFVTYKRAWVQPWAYYELGDESRQKLEAYFPDGYMMVKADDVVCEMRSEKLTDHWRMCIGLPATGQNGPSIGGSQLPLQKMANDLLNLHFDSAMQNVSTLFADTDTVNLDAYRSTWVQPGVAYPATRPAGMPLDAGFKIVPPATVSETNLAFYQFLTQYESQRATGVTPTMWGGQMGGAGATSSGYQFMSTAARKRLSVPWGAMKLCNEETDLLAFDLFRKTATSDLTFIEKTVGGEAVTRTVSVDDLWGNVRIIHESADEIPVTPSEERDFLMTLLPIAANNPMLMQMLLNPSSLPFIKSRLGLKELILPTELPRTHQRVEIKKLLESRPAMAPGPDGVPVPMAPSIVPNPTPGIEDHEQHMAEIRDWWESLEARRASEQNPMGTANVILHYLAHQQLMAQAAAQAAMAAGQIGPQPGPPGPQPAGPQPMPPRPRPPQPARPRIAAAPENAAPPGPTGAPAGNAGV